jgi:hypothetical protein
MTADSTPARGARTLGRVIVFVLGTAWGVLAAMIGSEANERNCQELWMRFLGQAATDPLLSVLVVSG